MILVTLKGVAIATKSPANISEFFSALRVN